MQKVVPTFGFTPLFNRIEDSWMIFIIKPCTCHEFEQTTFRFLLLLGTIKICSAFVFRMNKKHPHTHRSNNCLVCSSIRIYQSFQLSLQYDNCIMSAVMRSLLWESDWKWDWPETFATIVDCNQFFSSPLLLLLHCFFSSVRIDIYFYMGNNCATRQAWMMGFLPLLPLLLFRFDLPVHCLYVNFPIKFKLLSQIVASIIGMAVVQMDLETVSHSICNRIDDSLSFVSAGARN